MPVQQQQQQQQVGREVLKRVEKDQVNCAFHDMRRVVSDLEKLVGGTAQAADSFDLLRHVDYVDFRDAFDSLVANRRAQKTLKKPAAKTKTTTTTTKTTTMDSLSVWREIYARIKGGQMAAFKGAPLEEDEYLGLGAKECLLEAPERAHVYGIFREWQRHCNDRRLWDNPDRVLSLINRISHGAGWREGRAPFDYVYLDECQVSDVASMLPSFDI